MTERHPKVFFARSVLILGLLWAAVPACASARQQDATPDPWDIRLEFGLNGASGNATFTILRGGFSAKRVETDQFELEFASVVRYGKNDEKVIADDARASVKFDWHPEDRFTPFLFVDARRDKIRRIDFQSSGGAGAKLTILSSQASEVSASLAAIYDYQNFALAPSSPEEESDWVARWSSRLAGERRFGNGAQLDHTLFYQPAMADFGDYVIEATTSLSTSLLGSLSLAVEHVYLRDSRPPPGAERNDQKYSVLFRLVL